jgi:broad specificity phosphatase PhoE
MEPRRLRGKYVLLRHGLSVPNKLGLIVSAPAQGLLPVHGLTLAGIQQAERAGEQLRAIADALLAPAGVGKNHVSSQSTRILFVASDFSRTHETACAAAKAAGGKANCDVRIDVRLRERFFGAFDLTPISNYDVVWKQDSECDGSSAESVYSVTKRVSAVVEELEAGSEATEYGLIVLSSHGDALQICQAWMTGCPAHLHRSLPHLGNGEMRCVPELSGL